MKIEYDQLELEAVMEDLLLRPQGLMLAPDRDEPAVTWKIEDNALKSVSMRVAKDTSAVSVRPMPETAAAEPAPKPAPEPPLDPAMFPAGTNISLLKKLAVSEQQMNKRPVGPNESLDRLPPRRGGDQR